MRDRDQSEHGAGGDEIGLHSGLACVLEIRSKVNLFTRSLAALKDLPAVRVNTLVRFIALLLLAGASVRVKGQKQLNIPGRYLGSASMW
jgi:hypothetical protein